MPKISIVSAYYNRKQALWRTLKTIEKSSIKDIEFILVDDASQDKERVEDFEKEFDFLKVIRVDPKDKKHRNPCIAYNLGFSKVTGDIVVIQSPECLHVGDILSIVAKESRDNQYLVFSCYSLGQETTKRLDSVDFNDPLPKLTTSISSAIGKFNERSTCDYGKNDSWIIHPKHRPAHYHFLTALPAKDLYELGGFDERFSHGYGYDDTEFAARIVKKGMAIKLVDAPICIHQYHQSAATGNIKVLTERNKTLYNAISKKNNYKVNNRFMTVVPIVKRKVNKKRVLTIVGTRPELIRLSVIIKKLDQVTDHVLVWTGQNYDDKLSTIFFEDLGIRKPDYYFEGHPSSFATQINDIFYIVEKAIIETNPAKALILGDTNSALSAIVCEKMGVPVYHMEAGNRCFDDKVPEERNRKIIDHCVSYNLPYIEGSQQHLLKESIPSDKIFITGNPIYEVMQAYRQKIDSATPLGSLGLKHLPYYLATFHRTENVDNEGRLLEIIKGLENLKDLTSPREDRVICSVHPRTRNKLDEFGIKVSDRIILMEPVGFFDFVKLEIDASLILTDSGTVQEESCLLNTPAVIMRDSTERVETLECGSAIISGLDSKKISEYATIMLDKKDWEQPKGYVEPNVSDKVLEILDV